MAKRTTRKSPRLVLAPIRGADRQEFLKVSRSSRALHRPWVSPPTTPAAFTGWLREGQSVRRERRLLRHREDGRVLGYVAANEIVLGAFRSAYLGYWVAAGEERQGYMTEGLEAWIRHLFTRRAGRLHRLEANIQPDNEPSIAVARACGLMLEGFSPRYLKVAGRWRDHQRWALTREDWRENGRGHLS